MAVTFGLSLSVSWICCLLIGGITCFTLQGDAYGHPACTGPEPTRSQASVVSGPNAKATGHNTLASVTPGPTANHTSAEAARASAEATANHASAEAAAGLRTSAEAARASAEATANHTSAEAARASAEATANHASAEAAGPRASAEATANHTSAEAAGLEQTARPLNKLDREIIIWFAQLLNRLSPVTVPPFAEKGKGN
ncbi:coiled-coil domain-containing protein 8-like [Oncorhynchus nerka]|uniref:coiled-coil domain-containing protein 8-like n=1 Tax=Oncorhynchus nerka TaxID=8023 RepID=UPI0031B8A4A8